MVVKMGGNVDVDRIGELETRNDEDVIANDAIAHHTGVYEEFGDPMVLLGVSGNSSISCCLHLHTL